MEAKVPVLNTPTEDTKILVNQGGRVRQVPASEMIPEIPPLPQGVAVADAAGSAPTAAEFKALLDSLRGAGIIATAAQD